MSAKIEDVVKRLRDRAEARRRSGKLLQIDDRMFDLIADEIEAAVKVLEADRDNWRRQALDEDARANAINFAANTNVDAKVYSKSEMIESVVKAATQAVQLTNEKFARSIGNAAAMREALSDACYAMFNFLKTQNGGYEEMAKALDKAKSTLAKPPRNCDIYTMAEQSKRHEEYCKSHSTNGRCVKCPLWQMRLLGINCAIAWTNLPSDALEDNKKVANEKS